MVREKRGDLARLRVDEASADDAARKRRGILKWISNWFARDLEQPEVAYVKKLETLRQYRADCELFLRNRPDVTLTTSDLRNIFFATDANILDQILFFHKQWNDKIIVARREWNQNGDLSAVIDMFRAFHLKMYVPVLQGMWISERSFNAAIRDDNFRSFLADKTDFRDLLKIFHPQMMRYKMKFQELHKQVGKFVDASDGDVSQYHALSERMRDTLHHLSRLSDEVNQKSAWAPVETIQSMFEHLPFRDVTFRGRNGVVNVRNFSFGVKIVHDALHAPKRRALAYDLYLLEGSLLFGKRCVGRRSMQWCAWARLKDLRVSKNVVKDPRGGKVTHYVLTATNVGQQRDTHIWNETTASKLFPSTEKNRKEHETRLLVVEQDNLAGDLKDEIERLQSDSKSWKPYEGRWATPGFPSSTMDISARLRCAIVMAYFLTLYVVGAIVRLRSGEFDANDARSSAPRGILPWLANLQLGLFGYFMPSAVMFLMRADASTDSFRRKMSAIATDEMLTDITSWFSLWISSRFIVEPVSNILCPLLTMGQYTFTVGEGRKGVASHTIMTLVAWGYAMLSSDSKWFVNLRERRFPTRRSVLLHVLLMYFFVLYSWMGYITARHYHSFDEIVAACAVGSTIIPVYVGLYDRISSHVVSRASQLGSSNVSRRSNGRAPVSVGSVYTAVWWFSSMAVAMLALFVVVRRFLDESFHLGSGFWLVLPPQWNGLCVLVGAIILYRQHGYILGALYAPIWSLASFLCFKLFQECFSYLGLDDLILYVLLQFGLSSDPASKQQLRQEMIGWDSSDDFALWTFFALAVCVVQVYEIPKYFFVQKGNRPMSGGLVGKTYMVDTTLHLMYYMLYIQLLAHMYGASISSINLGQPRLEVPAGGGAPEVVDTLDRLSRGGLTVFAVVIVPISFAALVAALVEPITRKMFDACAKLISTPPSSVEDVSSSTRRDGSETMSMLSNVASFVRSPSLSAVKMKDTTLTITVRVARFVVLTLSVVGIALQQPLVTGVCVPIFFALGEVYDAARARGSE